MNTGIIAYAFGTPATIQSNLQISQIASKKARAINAPIYTQRDVFIAQEIDTTFTDEIEGNPPPTLRIARGGIQWAKDRRITKLWIVAAEPHLWRAVRDTEKAIIEAKTKITTQVCKEIMSYPKNSWFCIDAAQEHARTREAWNKRENILRVMPFFIYKNIAN